MNKYFNLFVLVGIIILSFTSLTSCGRSTSSLDNSSVISADESTDAVVNETKISEAESSATSVKQDTTVTSETSAKQDTNSTIETSINNGITLESVKKAALDAGYAAEDISEIDMQAVPRPVRGIFVNYVDENLQSQCPVYEFKDSADAMEYARQVNDSGYSLCIVNDKLLAMTSSEYGVILNDKEKSVLESFLNSSFLPYNEPALPPINPDKDYAGAASRIERILRSLDKLVNKSVVLHSKSLPVDDPKTIDFLSFSMVTSADLSFTAPLSEDQEQIDSVIQTWELYGCTDVKMKHDKPHDYTMTGKRAGMEETFTIHCIYSPERDAVSITDVNGKDMVEFYEFVPLGNDQYAFQTLYERAMITYKDGYVSSFIYSLKPRTSELAYNPKIDNIYPNAASVNEAWVLASGEDTFDQMIVFDGTKLSISATDFTGSKLTFDMNVMTD